MLELSLDDGYSFSLNYMINVGVKECSEVIRVRFLSKSDGYWWWLLGYQVLEISYDDFGIEESRKVVDIKFLCKGNNDGNFIQLLNKTKKCYVAPSLLYLRSLCVLYVDKVV